MNVVVSVLSFILMWIVLVAVVGGWVPVPVPRLLRRKLDEHRREKAVAKIEPMSQELLHAYAQVDAELRSHDFEHKLRVAATVMAVTKPYTAQQALVGSVRRGVPEPGDVDILVRFDDRADRAKLLGALVALDPGVEILHDGQAQLQVEGVKVDIIILSEHQSYWGFAKLQYTGSRDFNALVRHRAKHLGYKISERRIYSVEGSGYGRTTLTVSRDKTEAEILQLLGLSQYADPHTRSYVRQEALVA